MTLVSSFHLDFLQQSSEHYSLSPQRVQSSNMAQQNLTEYILSIDSAAYARATQAPFLAAAAKGQIPKETLGHWLANDRMYIHAYIRGLGRLLGTLQLPSKAADATESNRGKLLDWAIEALASLRQEEKFFIQTASEYGLAIDLTSADGKLDGLRRFEAIFEDISGTEHMILPWLEAAVVFYATEKCYLDAWSWAKEQMQQHESIGDDADGGALRDKFIPQWSNAEFAKFVNRLGGIIDDTVTQEIKLHGEGVRSTILKRAGAAWSEVLVAEEAFWPKV
jgi:thiaminase